ncbi:MULTISPECIES: diacylglycerol/lipid kinase family protein [unclassified Nocardioides]|uniref:diacylglycerol/lipid kinase family protein n=1 Tax=Nocardioides sp. URHA0032 TaxID=1380388 RepID=UPI00048AF756|nr:YegS/Rv2252/BmrU family lipid kinase [Nocardioides sp. URHA0032]
MDPLLVITNSEAGTADEENLAAALAVLRERTSVEVAATSNPGELDGVLHRAGSRPVVVAGGDGSLHAVIAALHRRRDLEHTVLGLLPLGTGNDFARGIGIPLDIEEAANVVLRGRSRPMDLIVDEVGEVVVNSVHVGVGAEASRRAVGLKERLGRFGYPLGALLTALDPPLVRLRVEVDGEVVTDLDDPVLMVAIGNGSSVGGGTELTPDADPKDGLVDVLVSRSTGPLARVLYTVRLGFATHHHREDVSYRRGRTVSVSGGPFWCSADGEIYGPERQRTWHVEPAAYSMLLP